MLYRDDLKIRDKIINTLNKHKINVRPIWKLIHTLNHFSSFPRMNLSQSIKLEKKIINLPSSSNLRIK